MNREAIRDPDLIFPGQKIRIPTEHQKVISQAVYGGGTVYGTFSPENSRSLPSHGLSAGRSPQSPDGVIQFVELSFD